MDTMSLEGSAASAEAEEMDELRDALISHLQSIMMDETEDPTQGLAVYINISRKALMYEVAEAHAEKSIDKLRMFAKVESPIQTFRFAEYARADLTVIGLGVDAVTPQILADYMEVVQARTDLLEDFNVGYRGNSEILRLLIEEPSATPTLIHMINTLRISDVDKLAQKAREYVAQGFSEPLLNGTL